MSNVIRGAGGVGWAASVALGMVLAFGTTAQASPQYTMDCTKCHTMPPVDSGSATKDPTTGGVPGNHQKHAATAESSCVVCHNQGASDVMGYNTSHRNKKIELAEGLGYTRQVAGFMNQTSVPPNPLGTCATAVCHSDGKGVFSATPVWSQVAPFAAPGDCNKCHGVAPGTGSHSKHVAYFGSVAAIDSCSKCHSAHNLESKPFSHATSVGKRAVEVKFAGSGSFAANQCSNLYCHSNGQATPTYTTPTWGGTLTCAGCHGNATSATLSGKHASHVNNATVLGTNYGCVVCHSSTVTDNTTISSVVNHVNGTKDVSGAKVGTAVTGTCATTTCHQDGKGTQKTVTWTGAVIGCNGCHGSDGTPAFASVAGEPNYVNAGADVLRANSHKNHVASAASCQNCHSTTTVDGLTIKAGAPHTDGTMSVVAGNGKSFDITGSTCSNISCHSGGGIIAGVAPAKWGASLGCVGCHGDAGTLASNAHSKHVNVTTGKGYACATCHSATVSSGNSPISDTTKHGDGTVEVQGASVTFTAGADTCATSCHGTATPTWTNTASGACGTCHAALSTTGGVIATNAHDAHLGATSTYGPGMAANTANSCAVCHTYTTEIAATHVNGVKNLQAGFSANGACSTCHKQTTNWTTVGRISCESCHSTTGGDLSVIGGITAPDKTLAATSGHGKAGVVQGCVACHDNTSTHINGALSPTDNRLKAGLTGSANAECNFCHTTAGTITADKLKALNLKAHRASGLGSACSDCHDPHGTANTMMVKTTIDSTTISFTGNSTFANAGRTGVCQACHMTTAFFTKAGQPVATHVDSTTNCLDCHQHNPASGLAFMANGGCDACHGYPPAPRETAVAVTFGLQNNWSSARFEDYSGGGGAHLVAAHIPKNAKPADGWVHCIPCHSGGNDMHARALPARNHVDNVTVLVDPQYRFSQTALMSYTTAQLVNGGANKTGNCFNVSCHFKPSPKWSTER